MSAAARREAAALLQARGIPERRISVLVGISRSSMRYQARPRTPSHLRARMRELAEQHPRYGYRRIHALISREGVQVNLKTIYRLWKQEQLAVRPGRKRKRFRGVGGVPQAATAPNQVWTYDFLFDQTVTGQRLKFLTLTDEFTRESLAIEVGTSFTSYDVQHVLAGVFLERPPPAFIRSDNGSEFIARDLAAWLALHGSQTRHIEPGCPWQNGFAESFHARFRDECLNLERFRSPRHAGFVARAWRRFYNEERPHSSLSYATPAEYARALTAAEPVS